LFWIRGGKIHQLRFFLSHKKNSVINIENHGGRQSNNYLTYSKAFHLEASNIVSKKTLEKLKQLQNYQYPIDAKFKLKEKFPFSDMDEEEINMCIDEFKKYISLVIIKRYDEKGYDKNNRSFVSMSSEIVDEVWHNLILFTKEYVTFSYLLFDEYLHHTPSSTNFAITNNDVVEFIKFYKKYFGDINPIWYYKINKTIKNTPRKDMFNSASHVNHVNKETIPILSKTYSQYDFSDSRSKNTFANIGENAVIYDLSMNSAIYSIMNNPQMIEFLNVCDYSSSDSGGLDGGGCGGGGCGGDGCGGCGG